MTKKNVIIVSVSILLVVVIGLIVFYRGSDSMIVSRALNVIDSLQAGKDQEAQRDFHSKLKAMMPAEDLGKMWRGIGPLKERTVVGTHVTDTSAGKGVPGKTVDLKVVFVKGTTDVTTHVHIPFDTNNKITGLMIDEPSDHSH
ncbi:MAG: hypothetical protein NT018_10005 [Armatimonadetes bacterium]|nr:hypothetical protein [Armatimonadota bacterium]